MSCWAPPRCLRPHTRPGRHCLCGGCSRRRTGSGCWCPAHRSARPLTPCGGRGARWAGWSTRESCPLVHANISVNPQLNQLNTPPPPHTHIHNTPKRAHTHTHTVSSQSIIIRSVNKNNQRTHLPSYQATSQ